MTQPIDDRRTQRTRQALFTAFAGLALNGRYDDIRVLDIARRAGVGRSTFYDHFQGKDELVLYSMTGFLSVLADTAVGPADQRLVGVLGHFWQNRRLARRLLLGDSIAPRIEKWHAQLVAERLTGAQVATTPPVAQPLLAAQIAAAQIGLVRAWLTGNVAGSPDQVAELLSRASAALVAGLGSRAPGSGTSHPGRQTA
jgi:AcrR family transcriptional regulator